MRLTAFVRATLRRTRLARAGQAGLVALTAGLGALSAAVVGGVSPASPGAICAAAVSLIAAGLAFWLEVAPSTKRVAGRLDRAMKMDGALRTALEYCSAEPRGPMAELLVDDVEHRLDRGARSRVVPSTVAWPALPLVAFAVFALLLENSRSDLVTIDPRTHWQALSGEVAALLAGDGTAETAEDNRAPGSEESAAGEPDGRAALQRLVRSLEHAGARLEESTDRAELESTLAGLEHEIAGLQRELADQPWARAALDGTRARVHALRQGLGLAPESSEIRPPADSGTDSGGGGVTSPPLAGTMGDPPRVPETAASVPLDVGIVGGKPWPARYDAVVEAFVGGKDQP